MPAIGALEKSVRAFAAGLEKQGFACTVDVYKSGQGRTSMGEYASYVSLDMEREADDCGIGLRFFAGGYEGMNRDDISGRTWKEMKAEALRRIEKRCPGVAPVAEARTMGDVFMSCVLGAK